MAEFDYKLRVLLSGDDRFFGPGVFRILNSIDQTGSLRQTCFDMGISYTKAWNLIKKVEKNLDMKLLRRTTGGEGGGSSILTAEAHNFLHQYAVFVRELTASADELFIKHFGANTKPSQKLNLRLSANLDAKPESEHSPEPNAKHDQDSNAMPIPGTNAMHDPDSNAMPIPRTNAKNDPDSNAMPISGINAMHDPDSNTMPIPGTSAMHDPDSNTMPISGINAMHDPNFKTTPAQNIKPRSIANSGSNPNPMPEGNKDHGPKICAIITAAGMSSRMHSFKPLLPFGNRKDGLSATVIENVIDNFRNGGISDIFCITGMRAFELQPILKENAVEMIYNLDFQRNTMFDSIRLGVSQIKGKYDGFFLTPVDMPLIRPFTIRKLFEQALEQSAGQNRQDDQDRHDRQVMQDEQNSHDMQVRQPGQDGQKRHDNQDMQVSQNSRDIADAFIPVFDGKDGHPPLILSSAFEALLDHDGSDGLQGALSGLNIQRIALPDDGILLGLNHPEDYRNSLEILEQRECPPLFVCQALWDYYGTPPKTIQHQLKVAEFAYSKACELREKGFKLNAELLQSAAWVHDIAKGRKKHAKLGSQWLNEFGCSKIAALVREHAVYSEKLIHNIDELSLLVWADSQITGTQQVSIKDRFHKKILAAGGDKDLIDIINEKMSIALRLDEKIRSL